MHSGAMQEYILIRETITNRRVVRREVVIGGSEGIFISTSQISHSNKINQLSIPTFQPPSAAAPPPRTHPTLFL